MPLKTTTEATQILKLDLITSDHARLISYGKGMGISKREAAAKIIKEFLRKNVRLETE